MLKRLRQLRISLATKCQILFGTAVAAIPGSSRSLGMGGLPEVVPGRLPASGAG